MVGDNPYPGPRAFSESEQQLFFGRDEETRILTGLVLARREVLLFAASGAGKSSLLQAGLKPDLTREAAAGRRTRPPRMRVLPVTTVGGGVPRGVSRKIRNVFAFSVLLALAGDREPEELAGQTLAQGLAAAVETGETGGRSRPTLLVCDQFEQLFTHHLERWTEREGFFRQVAEALEEHPWLHVLFSIREDYLAQLTPYAGLLPDQLRTRFRLERLQGQAALEAVREPAARGGIPFAAGVAESLVEDLRRLQAGTARRTDAPEAGAAEPPLGAYVEPVHLQIVCHLLWANLPDDRRKLPADQRWIFAADVEEYGDVDEALGGFYDQTLSQVGGKTRIGERRLRQWFEERLITPDNTRNLVRRSEIETGGLVNSAVDLLKDAYVIRATVRGSDTWYELVHDRLVEPILASNRRWHAANLQPWQHRAELWRKQRGEELLLRGHELRDARRWAEGRRPDLEPHEQEFLDLSARLSGTRTNLADLGWGVILARDADPEVLQALAELLEHRRGEAGRKAARYYREFIGEAGYRPGETAQQFLIRHGAGFGPADPERMPYYLLIVADPATIPFEFQYELDRHYAVGRIHFDAPDDYVRYARSVVKAERDPDFSLPRRAAVFGPQHEADQATQMSVRKFLHPLVERLRQREADWSIEAVLAEEATKAELSRLLGGSDQETPALLLTAGHTLELPRGDPRQQRLQGSLLCQDWPGPGQPELPGEEHRFAAEDVSQDARLLGLIAVLFGGTTAGTPRRDNFNAYGQEPKQHADEAFLSALAQRLLAHPNGGAVAVVGHVDRAWGYSIIPWAREEAEETGWPVFESAVRRLMNGETVGSAMERFNQIYALRFSRFTDLLQEIMFAGKQPDARELTETRRAMVDTRNYLVLGDPAARLAVREGPGLGRRPTIKPVLPEAASFAVPPGVTRGALAVEGAPDDHLAVDAAEDAPAVGGIPRQMRLPTSEEAEDEAHPERAEAPRFRGAYRTLSGDEIARVMARAKAEARDLFFSGVDAASGDYALAPMRWPEVARIAQGEPPPDEEETGYPGRPLKFL